METKNDGKMKIKKSNTERIYLSSEKLIEIIEISKKYGFNPILPNFNTELDVEYVYNFIKLHKWKLQFCWTNPFNGKYVYTPITTSKIRMNNYIVSIELPKFIVLELIDELNDLNKL